MINLQNLIENKNVKSVIFKTNQEPKELNIKTEIEFIIEIINNKSETHFNFIYHNQKVVFSFYIIPNNKIMIENFYPNKKINAKFVMGIVFLLSKMFKCKIIELDNVSTIECGENKNMSLDVVSYIKNKKSYYEKYFGFNAKSSNVKIILYGVLSLFTLDSLIKIYNEFIDKIKFIFNGDISNKKIKIPDLSYTSDLRTLISQNQSLCFDEAISIVKIIYDIFNVFRKHHLEYCQKFNNITLYDMKFVIGIMNLYFVILFEILNKYLVLNSEYSKIFNFFYDEFKKICEKNIETQFNIFIFKNHEFLNTDKIFVQKIPSNIIDISYDEYSNFNVKFDDFINQNIEIFIIKNII